ncbi:MAG TPA: hypothetical protein VMW35_13060 [Myxococcota bacterium]|jgi:hypothetical protein|nr:hypothetical protein [Myxococcota bacterium]
MSTTPPSMKGAFLQGVVADVQKLVERGAVPPAELEARLSAAERKLLAAPLIGALWYPVEAWVHMIELLRDLEGGADPRRYLVERGARAAARIIELGIFRHQIEAFQGERLARIGQIIATLAANIFNFGKWAFVDADGTKAPRIVISEASRFPKEAQPLFEGFIEALVREALHLPLSVRSARPSPEEIEFALVSGG